MDKNRDIALQNHFIRDIAIAVIMELVRSFELYTKLYPFLSALLIKLGFLYIFNEKINLKSC